MLNRARWFVQRGIQVVIVTTDGPMTPKYEEAGICVHLLSKYENDFLCLGPSGIGRFIDQIRSSITNRSVWLVGFDKKSLWFLNELAKRLPLGSVRIGLEFVALRIFYDFQPDELLALAEKSRIICMNEASRLYLKEIHKVDLPAESVVPLPVPFPERLPSVKLDQDSPVVISVCRLEEMKEYVSGLICGATEFFRLYPHGRLVIVGDGINRPKLETEAAHFGEKILFFGTVDPSAYVDVVKQASIFVGMGLSAVQAAQLGLPVVLATPYDQSFSSPGMLSEQAKGDFGEHVSGRSREGWSIVLKLLSDPALWLAEADACRRHAERTFSHEKNMVDYWARLEGLSPAGIELSSPSMPIGPLWKRLIKKCLIILGVR